MIDFPIRPTRAEINLDNLIFNYRNIKEKAGSKKICAVVKADAYGHGIESIKALLSEGIDFLAVAFLDEGVALRENGINNVPILILGPSSDDQLEKIVDFSLTPAIFSLSQAQKLNEIAKKRNIIQPIHIKIDTGMGRIGLAWDEASKIISKISELKNIKLEGIFSHLATADEADKSFTEEQLKRFRKVIGECESLGIYFPLKHIENSAALMDCSVKDFNMVRPGIILYGHYPSEEVKKENLDLKPVMLFKSKIEHLKWLKPGDSVGYGRTYIAEKPIKVATIPVGYADGYSRALSHKGLEVSINSHRAPVIGNICMDQIMVDVTDIDCKVGDDVELFGSKVSTEEIAEKLGTINYEITCMVSKRVPRVYIKDNQQTDVNIDILKD